MGIIPKMPGLTGGGSRSASIYYPSNGTAGETFPLIVYMHGGGTGAAKGYPLQLPTIAAFGFVVIAPETCQALPPTCNALCLFPDPASQGCAEGWGREVLNAVNGAREHPSVHPALGLADFSRLGIAGHSMGGMAAIAAATLAGQAGGYNIKAAVSQHPNLVPKPNVTAPVLFTGGTKDTTGALGWGNQMFASQGISGIKINYVIEGATHLEMMGKHTPTGLPPWQNREDAVVAQFLACHVRGEGCDAIYGESGHEVCTHEWPGKSHTALATCKVDNYPSLNFVV